MVSNPEYSIEIIVIVKFQGKYSWYLSDKEDWVLDYNKWGDLFGSEGKTDSSSLRSGFLVLSSENWLAFEKVITNKLVSKDQLSKMILNNLPIDSWDEKMHLFPSLYIDFDEKRLFSIFTEYLAFENLVPDNWIGTYDDFYSLIPDIEKYWIINGANYLPLS
jgi:hypothetical protein